MLNNTKNLIVTGNGADLYCGLNSKFSDFIKDKEQKIIQAYDDFDYYIKKSFTETLEKNKNYFLKDNNQEIIKLQYHPSLSINNKVSIDEIINSCEFEHDPIYDFLNNRDNQKTLSEIKKELVVSMESATAKLFKDADILKEYNFWEIVLVISGSPEKSWYDIEKEMSNFFLSYNNRALNHSIVDELQKTYNSIINNEVSKLSINIDDIMKFLIFVIINNFKGRKIYIEDFLRKELFNFEQKFSKFIKKELASHTEYLKKRDNLFSKLNKLTSSHKSNVLTFNYTMSNHPHNIKRIKSVHGNVYNDRKDNHSNIIIGIDANIDYPKNISDKFESTIYSYTKTYRTLNYQFNNKEENILENGIKNIIFFGHSLGDSDYSYFQSIFDYYNLYNSKVSLYFIFVPHGNDIDDDISARERQSDKVTRLLKNYGKTLNNKDHGKNLIHKLIIEDRLKIENLNNII